MWPDPDDPFTPQWLPSDSDKAVLWKMHEAGRCPQCGTFPDEWPDSRLEDPPYVAEPYRCAGCAEIADEREHVPSGRDGAGVYVRLVGLDPDLIDDVEAERDARHRAAKHIVVGEDPAKLSEPGPFAG